MSHLKMMRRSHASLKPSLAAVGLDLLKLQPGGNQAVAAPVELPPVEGPAARRALSRALRKVEAMVRFQGGARATAAISPQQGGAPSGTLPASLWSCRASHW